MVGGKIGKVQHGAVVVDQIVTVVAEEILVVIKAGDGKAAVKQIRPAVVKVCRVHGAHGAAKDQNVLVEAVPLSAQVENVGHQLLGDVAEPFLVILDAPAIVCPLGSPGFVVDAVGRVNGALPALNPGRPGVHHFEVLKVKKPAALTGNKQHRLSGMTVNLELHIPLQMTAVVLEVTNFHRISLFCS